MKFDASCFNRSRNFLSAVARLFELLNFVHSVVIKAGDVRWQRRVPAVSRTAAASRQHSITQNPTQQFLCLHIEVSRNVLEVVFPLQSFVGDENVGGRPCKKQRELK